MNKEEIQALKEVHYKNIRDMCNRYYNDEIAIKYTFIEEALNSLIPFEDRRLVEINRLIEEFTKERDRIVEIDKIGDSNE